jgi:hypothetical protein
LIFPTHQKCRQETRRDGNSAGLVVLATGLGKTWLANQKKEPVHHMTTQGDGRGSRAKKGRKLGVGQGR